MLLFVGRALSTVFVFGSCVLCVVDVCCVVVRCSLLVGCCVVMLSFVCFVVIVVCGLVLRVVV